MALLQPSEYDISYFDGNIASLKHNAGYSKYDRWKYIKSDGSETNIFKEKVTDIMNRYAVGNKRILEICSAKGFVVQDMRDAGFNAFGVDVSQYAYDQADPSVQPYLTVADIRIGQSTFLSDFNNNYFSLIIGMVCLCCFSDAEITAMVTELNRISSDQFYVIDENARTDFYNSKTIQQWRDGFAWEQGTVFVKSNRFNDYIISEGQDQLVVNVDFVTK